MYRVARQENMPTLRNVSRRPSREYAEEAEQRSLVRAATPALGSQRQPHRSKLCSNLREVGPLTFLPNSPGSMPKEEARNKRGVLQHPHE